MAPGLFAGENRKWWTLAAVAFGLFMIMLDNTVVNVALPSIQRDLGVGLSELEWIVAGYALTFAALMLTTLTVAGRHMMFRLTAEDAEAADGAPAASRDGSRRA